MLKSLVLSLATLIIAGCGRTPAPVVDHHDDGKKVPPADVKTDAKQAPQAEVKIGGGQDEPPQLQFSIVAVYGKQKPSSEAPFHTSGGEWTFFDCQAKDDPNVVFTIGVASKGGSNDAPAAWGKAELVVKDQDAGGRFVERFSRAFSGKIPTPRRQPYVCKPLGEAGGFSGKSGGWTATKWFVEQDGLSAEVFFNFNLEMRQGEFSEKDADYADDLVAAFASVLRDGPRPERTPENDPNLTRIGPAIGRPRKLLPRLADKYTFSPNGRLAVYSDKAAIIAFELDDSKDKSSEVARFANSPWDWRVADDNLDLLVQEGIPANGNYRSSDDPMQIWWVNGKTKERKLLRGPEKDLNLVEEPISPDQRYVVLSQWKGDPHKGPRTEAIYILDLSTGSSVTCKTGAEDLSVIGWKRTNAGLRMFAVSNRWGFDKTHPTEWYTADPATGVFERHEKADPQFDLDHRLSPNGKRRVQVGKNDLTVTGLGDGRQRRFVFHPDDLRFVSPECVEWVTPRYLKFNGPRLALIDVVTMKMCFPDLADKATIQSAAFTFSQDFRWVLYQAEGRDSEGFFLAPVEMPKEK